MAYIKGEGLAFEEPADLEAPIWRYMTFTKFVALLHRRLLYFTRVDRLIEDPYEGALTTATMQAIAEGLRVIPDDDQRGRSFQDLRYFLRALPGRTFVNCWTLRSEERRVGKECRL